MPSSRGRTGRAPELVRVCRIENLLAFRPVFWHARIVQSDRCSLPCGRRISEYLEIRFGVPRNAGSWSPRSKERKSANAVVRIAVRQQKLTSQFGPISRARRLALIPGSLPPIARKCIPSPSSQSLTPLTRTNSLTDSGRGTDEPDRSICAPFNQSGLCGQTDRGWRRGTVQRDEIPRRTAGACQPESISLHHLLVFECS